MYLLGFMIYVWNSYEEFCIVFSKLKYKNKSFHEFLITKSLIIFCNFDKCLKMHFKINCAYVFLIFSYKYKKAYVEYCITFSTIWTLLIIFINNYNRQNIENCSCL